MEKVSRRLREQLAAGPASTRLLRLVVTLEKKADWEQGWRQLSEAGLQVIAREEAIRVVFGQAEARTVPKIAQLPVVQLVELDEEAQVLG